MDGGAWRAAVLGVAQRRTRLSDFTYTLRCAVLSFSVSCALLDNILLHLSGLRPP